MKNSGFILSKLQITGEGKKNAEIPFKSGLNIISGASDTGKSYILQCIDFTLGAGTAPEDIPESEGYSSIWLEASAGDNIFTLRRGFKGGGIELYECAIEDTAGITPIPLSSKHNNQKDSVSGYLLEVTGLRDKFICKNSNCKKVSLSFRNIAHLTLINEEKIISKNSPILSGQAFDATVEKSLFKMLLTGIDDTDLVEIEKDEIRKARLNGKLELLAEVISERQEKRSSYSFEGNVKEESNRVQGIINEKTASVSSLKEEITTLDSDRTKTWDELQKIESRLITLNELSERFKLLAEHYEIDTVRLQAISNASTIYSEYPNSHCPLCGSHNGTKTAEDCMCNKNIEAFKSACSGEKKKIEVLVDDLDSTIKTVSSEYNEKHAVWKELKAKLKSIDVNIERGLLPILQERQAILRELLRKNEFLSGLMRIQTEIEEFSKERDTIEGLLKEKGESYSVEFPANKLDDFCIAYQNLLKAWNYPDINRVVFNNKKSDVIINGQERASHGKGYRAITHAAFTVCLMLYCKQNNLPYSTLVILDSPVLSFKEKDLSEEDKNEKQAVLNMKDSFYESLSEIIKDEQVIVLENTEPSESVQKKTNYIHFSKSKEIGRYGLFPVD
jgi:hypothetical protein